MRRPGLAHRVGRTPAAKEAGGVRTRAHPRRRLPPAVLDPYAGRRERSPGNTGRRNLARGRAGRVLAVRPSRRPAARHRLARWTPCTRRAVRKDCTGSDWRPTGAGSGPSGSPSAAGCGSRHSSTRWGWAGCRICLRTKCTRARASSRFWSPIPRRAWSRFSWPAARTDGSACGRPRSTGAHGTSAMPWACTRDRPWHSIWPCRGGRWCEGRRNGPRRTTGATSANRKARVQDRRLRGGGERRWLAGGESVRRPRVPRRTGRGNSAAVPPPGSAAGEVVEACASVPGPHSSPQVGRGLPRVQRAQMERWGTGCRSGGGEGA